jgi:hypothetical protein
VVFRHFYTVASCTCRLEYAAAGTAGESQLSSDAMRSLCVLDRRCRDDKIDRWTDELADDCVTMGVKKTWELAVGLAPRNTRLTAACRRRPTASLQKTGQENS